jgi:DNA repair protein RecN (Recombination protein N)
MIERIYLKNHILFKDIELFFSSGLIVFTGSSGSGKSIFFQALLSVFALDNSDMDDAQITMETSNNDDELSIFEYKKINNKNRYYIDDKNISKNLISQKAKELISFLHVQDFSDFSSKALIDLLDTFISSKDKKYTQQLQNLKDSFYNLTQLQKELSNIQEAQQESIDKKEFLEFEINKIKELNPTIDEYDRLMKIKKDLSKKEKLEEQLLQIEPIFDYEDKIAKFLNDMAIDNEFVNTFISELTEHIETSRDKMQELEEYDIENILDRIDKLSKLQQRYGSIEEALEYQITKQKQLDEFENIEFEQSKLIKNISNISKEVKDLSTNISTIRNKYKKDFEKEISYYCDKLYLGKLSTNLDTQTLDYTGIDTLSLSINKISFKSLSSGEINRLRLSLIALKNKYKQTKGILILDEIDANLSGVESESVAKILYEISQNYQVFSISHQPHLTSYAKHHFLVSKDNKQSFIKEIKQEDRIQEIARMISGSKTTQSSLKLAKELCANKDN